MPKVYNKRHNDAPSDSVYVGRPSIYGNPFHIGKDGTRDEVIEKFESHLNYSLRTPGFRERLVSDLKGKDLICWCTPRGGLTAEDPHVCHAQTLLRIANEE